MSDCWVSPGWVETVPEWVENVCGVTTGGGPVRRRRRPTETVRAPGDPESQDEEELIALLEAAYNG